uniref:Uncharacterized protein n=1 Tax=Lactuca sativa TaxID=4236 RepID=A0A9R1WUW7_LACSA|nr:hypothetical protein LSAT_V11C800410940 [Lactuca sativa]
MAFFKGEIACDAVKNGIVEFFNVIIIARKKSLLTMLEEIRNCHVYPSRVTDFEVRNGYAYVIDLEGHVYTCRLWEMSSIPYIHG